MCLQIYPTISNSFIIIILLFQIDKTSTTSKESNEMNGTQNSWMSRVVNETITDVVDEADAPKIRERRSSHHSLTPSPEQNFGKKLPQYNSFRVMKQKVNVIFISMYLNILLPLIIGQERIETPQIPFGSKYRR